MSGTFPTTKPSLISPVHSPANFFDDDAHSGISVSRSIPGAHKWLFSIDYTNLIPEEYYEIIAFIVSQGGVADSFNLPLHSLGYKKLGSVSGNPGDVFAAGSKGDTTISTYNWPVSTSGLLLKGDILTFANHNKLYMFTQNVDSDVSGGASITVYPPIFADVPVDTNIVVTSVNMTAKVKDTFSWTIQPGHFSNFTIEMREVTN